MAAQEFARAKAKVEAILADVSGLEALFAEHNRAVRCSLTEQPAGNEGSVRTTNSAAAFARYKLAAAGITTALARERVRLDDAQAAMNRSRDRLIEAMKQRKAMSRLAERERGRQERRHEYASVKELDDLHATHAACVREANA
ncbi:MAG: hypothetical protein ACE15C_00600 [Phycisphaerae bacterium]